MAVAINHATKSIAFGTIPNDWGVVIIGDSLHFDFKLVEMRLGEFKVLVAGLAVASFALQGCNTYEDGPAISLKSKNQRLTGEWRLVNINGQTLEQGEEIVFEFEKDGDFIFSYSYAYDGFTETYKYAGSWEWLSGKETIFITGPDLDAMTFEVQRLSSDELHMRYSYGGSYIQDWEFVKQ